MNGLGLTGPPTISSKPYLKANIEGGEKFNWFYADGDNLGRGFDPLGTDLQVSLPAGDRLTQSRSPYSAGQQILANKQLRWWWNNHASGHLRRRRRRGLVAARAHTRMGRAIQSRSLSPNMACRRVDKATNQPNVFLRSALEREFDALLVELGSDRRRRLSADAATIRSPLWP